MSTLAQFFKTEQPVIIKGVSIEGGILGLLYESSGAHEMTVHPGACKDEYGIRDLFLPNAQQVNIPTTANTIFNMFLCDDNTVKTDTDVQGGAITIKKRWIGFCVTDGSGVVHPCLLTPFEPIHVFFPAIRLGSFHVSGAKYSGGSATLQLGTIGPLEKLKKVGAKSIYVSGAGPRGHFWARIPSTNWLIYNSAKSIQIMGTIYDGTAVAGFGGIGAATGGWSGAGSVDRFLIRR